MKMLHVTPQKCTACKNCELACSFWHSNGYLPSPRIKVFRRAGLETGHGVVVCFQCDKAACVAACPANALWRNLDTGAIFHIRDRCIRCGSCVAACPFGNMHWDAVANLPAKCDLCDGDPACAKFCPTGALEYK